MQLHATKCGAGRIYRADLNGDKLRICKVCLRISDYCRLRLGLGLGVGLGLVLGLALVPGLLIVVYKLLEKARKF